MDEAIAAGLKFSDEGMYEAADFARGKMRRGCIPKLRNRKNKGKYILCSSGWLYMGGLLSKRLLLLMVPVLLGS